jgi:putative ATPase
MKELGYGKGYQYDHDEPDGVAPQDYLPDELRGTTFYRPSRFGHEATIQRRLDWWAEKRRDATRGEGAGGSPDGSTSGPKG